MSRGDSHINLQTLNLRHWEMRGLVERPEKRAKIGTVQEMCLYMFKCITQFYKTKPPIMLLVGSRKQTAGKDTAKLSGIFVLVLQIWEQTHFC